MMNLRKGILTAIIAGTIVSMTSGCSTIDLLLNRDSKESVSGDAKEKSTFDLDKIKVDEKVEAPKFTKNLKGKATYAVGEKAAKLKVKAEVETKGIISYQWYVNTVDQNGGGTLIKGADSNTYTPDTSAAGNFYYFVVATNRVDKSVNMTTSKMYEVFVDPDAEIAKTKDGKLRTGWLKDSKGKWFYYDEKGKKIKNSWAQIKGKWYLFDTDGTMLTGWRQVEDKWYYMNKDGAMQTGWLDEGGKRYFLEDSGAMHVGWLDGGGSWFYCGSNGALRMNEWEQVDGSWYYFNGDGVMLSNTEVNGRWLNQDGKLAE